MKYVLLDCKNSNKHKAVCHVQWQLERHVPSFFISTSLHDFGMTEDLVSPP